jgi:hypothetical protein
VSEDEDIEASVRKHGWHAIGVGGGVDAPSMLYTIGLCHSFSHPELVVVGLGDKTAYGVVRDMVTDIRAGKSFASGQRYSDILKGFDVLVGPVHPTQHVRHLGYAMAFYRRLERRELLSALQVFWPDKDGRFPTELTCDPHVAAAQPRWALAVPPSELKAFLDRYR